MSLGELARIALHALRRNKLRSGLTLLGVIIGVMTVVSVVSIIAGLNTYVETKLTNLNPDVLVFTKYGIIRSRAEFILANRRKALTMRETRLVAEECQSCAAVGAQTGQTLTVHAGNRKLAGVQVTGYTANVDSMLNLDITEGRFFNPTEELHAAPVAVIGADVKDQLFPTLDPIGRPVKIGGLPYQVVGVGESLGSAFGISFDNYVVAPFRAPLHRLLNRQPKVIDAVVVQTKNAAMLREAQERVRAVMRARHKLHPGQKDNFTMQTADSALEFWNKIRRYLVLAGIALPAIGLVVGAIVIMNIMLVAVAERTREIGIRKALGARRRDILAQFLIESATLSTLGAAFGIALGAGIATLVSATTPMPTAVAPWSVAVGVILGAGVGIVAGVYPASRASLLDPIAALRQE